MNASPCTTAGSRFQRLDKLHLATDYGDFLLSQGPYNTTTPAIRRQTTSSQKSGPYERTNCNLITNKYRSHPSYMTRDAANNLFYYSQNGKSYERKSDGTTKEFTNGSDHYGAMYWSPIDQKLYAARYGVRTVDVYGAPSGGTRIGTAPTKYTVDHTVDGCSLKLPLLDMVANPNRKSGGSDGTVYLLADSDKGRHVLAAQLAKPRGTTPEPGAAPPHYATPGCSYLTLADGEDSDSTLRVGKYVFASGKYGEGPSMYRLNTSVANGKLSKVGNAGGVASVWGRPAVTTNGKWAVLAVDSDNSARIQLGSVENPNATPVVLTESYLQMGQPVALPWPVADGNTVYCVEHANFRDDAECRGAYKNLDVAWKLDATKTTPALECAPSHWSPDFPRRRFDTGGSYSEWQPMLATMLSWWG
ncbi:hypothetical protein [Streptomyces huiliensis]|uniref:hypothetical protein n=1 Tax=Streptomyces huiliensis TaxID=2876027 RepID=UPI001CBD3165|nr:hypothetical protein [Streptomyces huiliensis]MBZ4319453.1 hypothetical protein [Streptomyces huiliensis]